MDSRFDFYMSADNGSITLDKQHVLTGNPDAAMAVFNYLKGLEASMANAREIYSQLDITVDKLQRLQASVGLHMRLSEKKISGAT